MKHYIGISTRCFSKDQGLDFIVKAGIKTIELNRKYTELKFREEFIEKIKQKLNRCNLSIHTATSGIFHKEPVFAKAETSLLKAEILQAKKIGAKQLVFHLLNRKLSNQEISELKDLSKFAQENRVSLLLENNSYSSVNEFLRILDKIPSIRICIDIGHLNRAKYLKYIKNIEEFIKPIKNKIRYLHIHNNYGEDEHAALDKGNFDYKKFFKMIDFNKIDKFIVETSSFKDSIRSKKILEDILR